MEKKQKMKADFAFGSYSEMKKQNNMIYNILCNDREQCYAEQTKQYLNKCNSEHLNRIKDNNIHSSGPHKHSLENLQLFTLGNVFQ